MSAGLRARDGDAWVERVRAASDIVEIVGQSVSLKRQGRNWVGLCPFHGEKTPSFSVNAERQFFHCFGCKKGGDVFRFVMDAENVGFVEAVERLSRRAGIPVPERRPGEARERGRKALALEALELAATAYEQWLADAVRGAAARAALEARGIARETQRAFRLGAAPEGWENLVRRLGNRVPEDVLIEAGLAARRERGGLYDRFRNRLIVPLVQPDGAVVGFGARALVDGDHPKYLNSPETSVYQKSRFVFGLAEARRAAAEAGELVVVEGYFDVLSLHQAGVRNVVATSGTALTAEHARALERVAPRVALTFDGDQAGQAAMLRSLGVLIASGLEVAVVDLPAGQDPDVFVRSGGRAAWDEARRAAADPVAFIQRHVLRASGGGDPRERALRAIVDLVVAAPDDLSRGSLMGRTDQVFGLTLNGFTEAVRRAVRLRARGESADKPVSSFVATARSRESFVEKRVLSILAQHRRAVADVEALIGPEDFSDPANRELARWFWQPYSEANSDVPEILSVTMRGLLADSADPGPGWQGELVEASRQMARKRLMSNLRSLELRMQESTDPDEQMKLQAQAMELGKSVKQLGV